MRFFNGTYVVDSFKRITRLSGEGIVQRERLPMLLADFLEKVAPYVPVFQAAVNAAKAGETVSMDYRIAEIFRPLAMLNEELPKNPITCWGEDFDDVAKTVSDKIGNVINLSSVVEPQRAGFWSVRPLYEKPDWIMNGLALFIACLLTVCLYITGAGWIFTAACIPLVVAILCFESGAMPKGRKQRAENSRELLKQARWLDAQVEIALTELMRRRVRPTLAVVP